MEAAVLAKNLKKKIMMRAWETSTLTKKSKQRKMIVRKKRNETFYNAIKTSIEFTEDFN